LLDQLDLDVAGIRQRHVHLEIRIPAAIPEALAGAVLEDKPPVMNQWTGAISINGSYSDGNTDKRTVGASGNAEYRREKDRFSLNALWNYTDEEKEVTERRVYGAAKYDYFLSKKSYALAQTSGEYDFKSGLDSRYTAGVGYGYQFKEDADLKVLGELGASYVNEDYVEPPPPTESTDAEFIAARVAYKVDWKPSEKFTVVHSGDLFRSLEDQDDVFGKLDTALRWTLTEKMFAQLQWIFAWDNTPAFDPDTTPPERKERTDNLVTLGIGWSF